MGADETKYSDKIIGDRGNHKQDIRLDITGRGYLGITQFDGDRIVNRALLSPAQVKALQSFVARPR